jgi:hydroxymethylglutaryl-CoA synthase
MLELSAIDNSKPISSFIGINKTKVWRKYLSECDVVDLFCLYPRSWCHTKLYWFYNLLNQPKSNLFITTGFAQYDLNSTGVNTQGHRL